MRQGPTVMAARNTKLEPVLKAGPTKEKKQYRLCLGGCNKKFKTYKVIRICPSCKGKEFDHLTDYGVMIEEDKWTKTNWC
ncbi:MAG: hypothetical protein SFU25_01590 [Candidatus Caenarcaniphilales bacterium]|nr:hypothetical protein [Candidatus Caenarcaniphilales bacterium]